ncbi:MAG: elongation factor P [Ktedonobacteraceae bacterium]|nr:elongation factor P [Ktedonobacteraceae bacterium]
MGNSTTTDFRNGMVIRFNNELYTITEFHHVNPGNWRAFVRTNLKSVRTGRVIEQRFRAGEEIDEVRVEHQNWQFLYVDGDEYVFMNNESFDQQPISKDMLGDAIKFLKEGDVVELLVDSATEKVVTIELPNFLELRVESAEPGVRGDTANNVTKPATLESGAVINVPLFVNPGDKIRVDTRTGKYVERVK